MGWTRVIPAVLAVAVVAGCGSDRPFDGRSAAPTPSGAFTWAEQDEITTASHWSAISANIADKILQQVPVSDDKGKALVFFVDDVPHGGTFSRSFRDDLVSQLQARKVAVTFDRFKADRRIHFETRSIPHRYVSTMPPTGVITALATGIFLVDGIGDAAQANIGVLGLPVAAEMLSAMGAGRSFTEVTITITVLDGETMLVRDESIYYVDPRQMHLYAEDAPPPPPVTHEPTWSKEPMPVRDFVVTND